MEGGHTHNITVTGADAAQVARALRQVDQIPLHKLRQQLIRENYQDWQRWERSLDWHDVMHGRYGLSHPETWHDRACPALAPATPPANTLPLWQHAGSHPEQYQSSAKESPVSAFIVSRAHIAVLVEACYRYELELLPADATTLGQVLWDENVTSVQYRYPDDAIADLPCTIADIPFVYAHGSTPAQTALVRDPWAVLKLVSSYQYQSDNHPTWECSDAWRLSTDLHDACLQAVGYAEQPAYDTDPVFEAAWNAAPWEV